MTAGICPSWPWSLREAKCNFPWHETQNGLEWRAQQVAEYFARRRGISPEQYRQKLDERFGKGEMRCPSCGSTKMLLIRIWSKEAGVVYELTRDGLRDCPVSSPPIPAPSMPVMGEQLALGL